MMITYHSRFLVWGEVWFDDAPGDLRSVDCILYHQCSQPVPGAQTKYFYTYAIDLTRNLEQLQANLNRDTAYKIRRARERDGIVCEVCDPRDPAVMDRFEQMYNQFAAAKGLAPLHREQMENMAAAGVLDLSVALDAQGSALVYHGNYRNRDRATGLKLPSLYRKLADSGARNLVGRANRYLTWSDILRYKAQGLKCFDFGGWYNGTDPGMLQINEFKKGFGGKVLREYQCERIVTFKGWLVLRTAGLLQRAKLLSNRPTQQPADRALDKVGLDTAATTSSGPTQKPQVM